jgi:DNA polymerase-3 subunit delta
MAATKSAVQHAFEFLEASIGTPLPPVVACFGSDDFLRRSVMQHVITSSGIEDESIRSFDGDESQWRDVHDQLATRSLFDSDGGRIAVVRNADKFVSKFRDQLERWIDLKAADCTLLLDIQTFPATTKLYNLVSKVGLLVKCTPPQKSSWAIHPTTKRCRNGSLNGARKNIELNSVHLNLH